MTDVNFQSSEDDVKLILRKNYNDILNLLYYWMFIPDGGIRSSMESASAISEVYINTRTKVELFIQESVILTVQQKGPLLLNLLKSKPSSNMYRTWFSDINDILKSIHSAINTILKLDHTDVLYQLYLNISFYYGSSTTYPDITHMFYFEKPAFSITPVMVISHNQSTQPESNVVSNWMYFDPIEKLHILINSGKFIINEAECDLSLGNAVPNIKGFIYSTNPSANYIYSFNRIDPFNTYLLSTITHAGLFQLRKLEYSDDMAHCVPLETSISTKNYLLECSVLREKVIEWSDSVSEETLKELKQYYSSSIFNYNIEDKSSSDDDNINNSANDVVDDSAKTTDFAADATTSSDTDTRDTSDDLLQLDTGDTKSPLNDYLFKECIDKLNNLIQNDTSNILPNKQKILLNEWCKNWLWLLDINSVKKFIVSFGLDKLITKRIINKE